MRYLSIDLETTGLDSSWCQTLEVGCVYADTIDLHTPIEELPSFTCRFEYDRVIGQPFALHLNAQLIKDMERASKDHSFRISKNYMPPEAFWGLFTHWIESVHKGGKKLSFSGKNYGTFDSHFLMRLPKWDREYFRARTLDPGQMFLEPDDAELPNLKTCIERAGLDWDESKHHQAIEDARMVVSLNRVGLARQWHNKTLPVYETLAQ